MRGDRGSASLYVLALCAVLAAVTATGVLVSQAVLARHRAGSAAELAALAAADRALDGQGVACAAAGRVAAAAGGAVVACSLRDGIVDVATTMPLSGVLAELGPARGQARAGPAGPAGAAANPAGLVPRAVSRERPG